MSMASLGRLAPADKQRKRNPPAQQSKPLQAAPTLFRHRTRENALSLGVMRASLKGMRIRYANERKLRAQMAKRGWTERQIVEALGTQGIPTHGKRGPATRYVHPGTGRSVVVDDATGEVFHVGGDGFEYR